MVQLCICTHKHHTTFVPKNSWALFTLFLFLCLTCAVQYRPASKEVSSEKKVMLAFGRTLKKEIGLQEIVLSGERYTFFFFFLYPTFIIYYPRTTLAFALPGVTQIRGHIAVAGSPSPSPHPTLRYVPSFLSREQFSIYSVVDSRRTVH